MLHASILCWSQKFKFKTASRSGTSKILSDWYNFVPIAR